MAYNTPNRHKPSDQNKDMKQTVITIDHHCIGHHHSPYIIAELSANHNGDIQRAFDLIKMAKEQGADAVKIQTYRADTMTIDSDKTDFYIDDGLWKGRTLFELYEWAHTPWEWHSELFAYAKKIGITLFSSPFDHSAIDLLEDLNTPAYKIASFEAIDLNLIQYAASTGKPLIISTGMANLKEIEEAITAAREAGCQELAILHCVSGYPAPAADYNLHTITDMQQRFQLPIGLSDHTLDNITALTSVALGACLIEKHVTLDRQAGGADDSFSLEPLELNALCSQSKVAWQALGNIDYGKKSSEIGNVHFRRSLYFVRDIQQGDIITAKDVRSIRPGYGIAPKYLSQVIGRTAQQNHQHGDRVTDLYLPS